MQAKINCKEKIRDLRQQFEEFWEQQKPTKGGGPPPFVGASLKILRPLLKSLIFPFNPFWLAGANQKITFWGPWTYLKISYILDVDLNIFIFVCFIP